MSRYDLITRNGHNMFDMSSMMQKAIRRGDYDRAGYAAMELSFRYRNYMWKRLLVISAEDCYGIMTKEIVALKMADDFINKNKKGEKEIVFISKAITLLVYARKNRDACYLGCNFMWADRTLDPKEIEEVKSIEECQLLDAKIPDWVFDVHTLTGKIRGETINDMIIREQEALTPHQVGLFDDPNSEKQYNWDKYLDTYNKVKGIK